MLEPLRQRLGLAPGRLRLFSGSGKQGHRRDVALFPALLESVDTYDTIQVRMVSFTWYIYYPQGMVSNDLIRTYIQQQ